MRAFRAAAVAAVISCIATTPALPEGIFDGAWMIPADFAVQLSDCGQSLCGSLVWLERARDATGAPVRDKNNPDPARRANTLCGTRVVWALRAQASNQWANGYIYSPDDGNTYRVKAELRSDGTFVARIYRGIPMFGEDRTLVHVPRLNSEGWC